MRRITALALMITLCLMLCSCTGSSDSTLETAQDIRASFLGTAKINANISMTAESGDRLYDFVVHFSGNEKDCEIKVIKPDDIAGLSAVVTDGKVSIGSGDVVFDIGRTLSDAISPLEAVPELLNAWKSERIDAHYAEKLDGIIYTVIETPAGVGGCTQKTWFGGDFLPVYAEIYSGGKRIIYCRFDSVELLKNRNTD